MLHLDEGALPLAATSKENRFVILVAPGTILVLCDPRAFGLPPQLS
jgi:hypothetical protein